MSQHYLSRRDLLRATTAAGVLAPFMPRAAWAQADGP